MKIRITALVVTALIGTLILSACGGNGNATPKKPGKSLPVAAADLADKIGATAYEVDTAELYVREEAEAMVPIGMGSTEDVTIRTFGTGQDMRSWLEAAATFGTSPMVQGDYWLIETETARTAEMLSNTPGLGGQIVQ